MEKVAFRERGSRKRSDFFVERPTLFALLNLLLVLHNITTVYGIEGRYLVSKTAVLKISVRMMEP